jgi:glycosyltransferase involved in cell wall biosynthesis
MKIVHISPGSGDNFYCENCLRDAALVKAMRGLGHDVVMVPLYLPLQADKTERVTNAPLFFGGVNVYLQQKFSLFRKTPRWIDKWFDSRKLLELAGRKAGMTNAKDLGETTLSMLKGEHGRQVKELDRLVAWLAAEESTCDVICLSNVLLAGLVPRLRKSLDAAVICLLQDEDGFLDGLAHPYAQQAWDAVRSHAHHIDAFLAVSDYFRSVMQPRLGVADERLHTVRMGVDAGQYAQREAPASAPTIGFLSRLCPERGLDTLIDAFILLKRRDAFKSAKLRLSGGKSAADEPFIEGQKRKLARAGVLADVEFLGAFDGAAKTEFLRSLSVLSVPEPKPVACGLYVLEALAMGVPVVEPAIGCFPAMIEATGGGVLYEPNTARRLAEVLASLLSDLRAAHRLGAEGREGLIKSFHIADTAAHVIRVCEHVRERSKRGTT